MGNDVDLFVTKKDDPSNTRYYPNGGIQKDYKNNVERIRINHVQHGDFFHVHVIGANFEDSQTIQNVSFVGTGCFNFDYDHYWNDGEEDQSKKVTNSVINRKK